MHLLEVGVLLHGAETGEQMSDCVAVMQRNPVTLKSGPGVGFLLREHPQNEASFAVRFEGGWDDGVLSGWQFEAIAYLPQVDEGVAASH